MKKSIVYNGVGWNRDYVAKHRTEEAFVSAHVNKVYLKHPKDAREKILSEIYHLHNPELPKPEQGEPAPGTNEETQGETETVNPQPKPKNRKKGG